MKRLVTTLLISLPLALSIPATSRHANASNAILPRQKSGSNANVFVTWWGNFDCSNHPNGGQQAIYGGNTVVDAASYSLSRDLGPQEQLDFSNPLPNGALINDNDLLAPAECALFVTTANPGNKTKGCHNLPESVACFKIWAH